MGMSYSLVCVSTSDSLTVSYRLTTDRTTERLTYISKVCSNRYLAAGALIEVQMCFLVPI
jgi:hypothetical protein